MVWVLMSRGGGSEHVIFVWETKAIGQTMRHFIFFHLTKYCNSFSHCKLFIPSHSIDRKLSSVLTILEKDRQAKLNLFITFTE